MIFLLCCDDISRHPHPQIQWTFCLDNALWMSIIICSFHLLHRSLIRSSRPNLGLFSVPSVCISTLSLLFPPPSCLNVLSDCLKCITLGLLVDIMSLFYSICLEGFVLLELVLETVHLVLALLFFAVIGLKHSAAYPLSNSRLSFCHVFAKDRKTAVNIKKKVLPGSWMCVKGTAFESWPEVSFLLRWIFMLTFCHFNFVRCWAAGESMMMKALKAVRHLHSTPVKQAGNYI